MMDIDIDVSNRRAVLEIIPHADGGLINDGKISRHPSAIYLQNVPIDPISGLSFAEDPFNKIDILASSVYEGIRDRKHIKDLLSRDMPWEVFESIDFVKKLTQIGNHAQLVVEKAPKSIEDLAILLALIRPNKAYLKNLSWTMIRSNIWKKEKNGYGFKKSHAFAYAMVVYMQAQLLIEN